jgi:hypothetical protein
VGQERAHRRYSPSQAERFFACKGSNNLLKRVPARASPPYAVEGTNAHTVFEAALANRVRDARVAHEEFSELFAEELDDGVNEFYLSIQIALDHVYSILDENPDAELWLERFVDPPINSAPGQAGGYCDVGIYVPSKRTLFVIDYKHGAGVKKSVKGNKQVMQYAAGFLYEANAPVPPEAVDSVVLTIIQPRAFHEDGIIREYEVTPYELWEYLEELDEVVADCERSDAALTPGPWCAETFCDARTLCPAREAQALQVAQATFSQIQDVSAPALPAPVAMDLNRLARIRFHAPALRKWLDDVDKHCEELARQGHVVPGAKLVETQAKRTYYGSELETARKLAALMGERRADEAIAAYEQLMKDYPVLNKLYNQKLIPVTSAEKQIVEEYKRRVGRGRKNKAAEEARQAFAFVTLKKSSGNLVLVDEDDKRPAVNRAQNQFAQIPKLTPPQ